MSDELQKRDPEEVLGALCKRLGLDELNAGSEEKTIERVGSVFDKLKEALTRSDQRLKESESIISKLASKDSLTSWALHGQSAGAMCCAYMAKYNKENK